MQNNPINIIRAELNEVELLRKISVQTFTETFAEVNTEANMQRYLNENLSLEKLKGELNNPASQFFFAKQNEQIIGYLKINSPDAQTENSFHDSLEIERIYVLKEYQHQKIGHQLLEKAIGIAKEKQYPYIWLGVWENNLKAINFYKRHGFVEFDTHVFQLGNDEQVDILMKLILN